MNAPELNPQCAAEIEKIQRQRRAQCLPALHAEQANRLRSVITARQAVLHRMRAGRHHTGSRLVPLGMTILAFVLVVGVAVLRRLLIPRSDGHSFGPLTLLSLG
jgi:hypothetical protein